MSGLETFDKTVQLSQEWVSQVAKELNLDNQHRAFQALRTVLHVLRDRLTIGEAANLGAELPILLTGFYYEGWKPERTPIKTRSKADFLQALQEHLHQYGIEAEFEPEQVARAVFRVMAERIPQGEMADVVGILSAEIKELFPEALRL
jgi:uncharacterized protein (DUF2267 family)